VPVYLVRHGKAGNRHEWAQPDELRPLDKVGRAQARGLARVLDGHPVARVLSSRYVRCLQTVEPLAAERRVPVERHDALAEEAGTGEVLALLKEVAGTDAVLCTHGNIVPLVLEALEGSGVHFADRPKVWKKGSAWVLQSDDGEYRSARYLPPAKA
jgi:phosphohistidine phosphatase SixA